MSLNFINANLEKVESSILSSKRIMICLSNGRFEAKHHYIYCTFVIKQYSLPSAL